METLLAVPVSYTHLDVYKRQNIQDIFDIIYEYLMMNELDSSDFFLTVTEVHLCVLSILGYKAEVAGTWLQETCASVTSSWRLDKGR